tara:strand:- start:86 stop:793 length:708 start_codon:yes stop_codon:yes gene_type:complete
MKKTLIFTATFNEAGNIKILINKILNKYKNVDLLIIDDNSPDKTAEVVKKFYRTNKRLKLIVRKKKLGLHTAHIMGYEYAIKNNYDKLITLDADLSHDPKEIKKFIHLLDIYSFVIGSRYMRGGKCEMSLFRYMISFVGNKLIKFVLKTNLNEFTTSYRGFNIKKLFPFHLNKTTNKGYSFFMETIFLLKIRGIRMKEIPITFLNRTKGKSKISKIEIFRTFKNLVKIFFLKKNF